MFKLTQKVKSISTRRYLKVAYDSGGRNKPTISFLHGIVASSTTWRPILDKIDNNKYRLITLEMLGFNGSPIPKNCEYDVNDHIKYLRRTIKKLHVKKPFKIVGHSMGSIIAASYANRYRFSISSEYLLSPPVYISEKSLHSKTSYLKNSLIVKAYETLLENRKFTINTAQKLRRMFKTDGLNVTDENWNIFKLCLKNTIIKQNLYKDVRDTILPIYIIYGALDGFLIEENIQKLAEFGHVKTTKLLKNDHRINENYAEEAARQIKTGF